MVTVSSAFMSSRRERIIFRVLSASGCAFKAAAFVDVLRAGLTAVFSETLGKTDLDNTDVGRDHSFRCIASVESLGARHHTTHVGLMVSIFQCPVFAVRNSFQPFPVRIPEMAGDCRDALRPRRAPVPRYCNLQLPSRFRRPVDDTLNFMPVRKTQAGARCSARFAA